MGVSRISLRTRSKRAGFGLASLAILVAGPLYAAFEFSGPRWDGASEFLQLAREKLGRERVVLGAQIDWSQLSERDAVLLLHPTSTIDVTEASAFVSAGGRLAVVDDFGSGDQLLSRFHIRREIAPSHPKEAHLDNPRLAIARPVETPTEGDTTLKHPMVSDVDQVVTNHPSAFATNADVELTPVLTIAAQEGDARLFAAIGVIGDGEACGLNDGIPKNPAARCGRLFAMADASVFIDLMMKFAGNRALASGLVEYLVESDSWGNREGKLYVLANTFQETGHFGGDDGIVRELERMLDNVSALLDETSRNGLPSQWSWLLAILAAAGTGAFAWHSSGKLYRRPTPRYARPEPLTAQAGAAGRAAVLSAPTTHATLVVLELKAAAEETLRQQLRLPPNASSAAILEAVGSSGSLDARSARDLKSVFQHFERAEKALVSAENLRLRPESIKQLQQALAALLPRIKLTR